MIELDPREQAERIAASPILAPADSLCRLLRYLAQAAVEQPGEPIREAQIARDVFGRGEHFDPRNESTVRVQTSRLRTRLADYYKTLGAEDDIILELPRGQYQIAVHQRGQLEIPSAPAPVAEPSPQPTPAAPRQTPAAPPPCWPRVAAGALAGLLAGALLMYWLYPVLLPPLR
jgi:hypothetical protein